MDQRFYDSVESNPVIAAVKDMEGLEKCCQVPDIKVIFALFGDICNITGIVKRIKEAGKLAIVHLDLVNGLNSKEIAADFMKEVAGADGIISTKPTLIRRAREIGLYTVMRFFILDSLSCENIKKQVSIVKPDFIEILPGLMPKVIRNIHRDIRTPVIAGGMITEKEDVIAALNAGAVAVSSTNPLVWRM